MADSVKYCSLCRGTLQIMRTKDGGVHPSDIDRRVYEDVGGEFAPCPDCCSSSPPQIPMAGGLAASSPCPPFHLIPTVGLIGLAERFQKGVERKGDKAWNAVSSNQACLEDVDFAIERISHIISHAMKLRDKLQANDVAAMAEDDDAGAIAWAGIFLYCVVDGLKKKEQNEPDL